MSAEFPAEINETVDSVKDKPDDDVVSGDVDAIDEIYKVFLKDVEIESTDPQDAVSTFSDYYELKYKSSFEKGWY